MPRFVLLPQEEYALTRRGSLGGVTGAIVQAAAAMAFNLYTNAQEDNIISVRDLPMGVPLIAEFALGGRVSTIITGVPRTTRAADAENVAAAMEQLIQQALVNRSPEHVSLDTVLLSLKKKGSEPKGIELKNDPRRGRARTS